MCNQPDKEPAAANWVQVRYAADFRECEMCGEPYCDMHDMHYADCDCVGPTQDGYEYSTNENGESIARSILTSEIVMTFEEYSKRAHATAIYPEGLAYPALGLAGEAGEVAEKVKKKLRDGKFDEKLFHKELGDVLWYLNELCLATGTTLSEIAEINVDKLESRQARGKLQGSGDER